MKITSSSRTTLLATAFLSATGPATAHSWVEYAYKLAQNGTMVGSMGYARGYVPRDSTNPPYTDTIPTNILPPAGQGAYSGNEILNKFPLQDNPPFPLLEAAPGDYIALMHLENGHTTLPMNNALKPKNRGTIFLYGTAEPKQEEKLFDIHLKWNKDGTGGDGRGRLLATRNYDDGQCYQPNNRELAQERANELAPVGALHEKELACQSDIKLPDDLKPGSIYTIYWYWDWPDLNPDAIDLESTGNGRFPWAGTFMRGEKDPNGFSANVIAKNESYSSVIDIKVTPRSEAFAAKEEGMKWVPDQNVYSMGTKEQMKSNFQVDVDGGQGGKEPAPPAQTEAPLPSPSTPAGGENGLVTTVYKTTTVEPPVQFSTVYVTVPADQLSAPVSQEVPASPATTTVTSFFTRSPTASTTTKTSFVTRSTPRPVESPSTARQEAASTTTKTNYVTRSAPQTVISATVPTTFQTRASSLVTPDDAFSTSFPGGEFHETPVPQPSQPVTPSQPANKPEQPAVTPFLPGLRRRAYRNV